MRCEDECEGRERRREEQALGVHAHLGSLEERGKGEREPGRRQLVPGARGTRDKTVSRHGRCGLRAGRGWRQWIDTKGSGVWHMARQRSLGGAYLAADVAAAHRVTRMLLDVLGLYKESCWLDALP